MNKQVANDKIIVVLCAIISLDTVNIGNVMLPYFYPLVKFKPVIINSAPAVTLNHIHCLHCIHACNTCLSRKPFA